MTDTVTVKTVTPISTKLLIILQTPNNDVLINQFKVLSLASNKSDL